MDLIGCPHCNERFLLSDSSHEGWPCPNCRSEMRVVAHRIPDGIVSPETSDAALPRHISRSSSGPPFHSD
jgi:PHP family Zn ribbon phosphoesterase